MQGHRRFSLQIAGWLGCAILMVASPALAAPGDFLWDASYDAPATFDAGKAVATSPDGSRVYVVGDLGTTAVDIATVAYDAATGAQLWAATFNGAGNYTDRAEGVAVSPDGSRVFVTGTSFYEGNFGSTAEGDVVTIAYAAATGAQLWAKQHPDSDGASEGCCVAVSPDGATVFVAGTFGRPPDPFSSPDGLTAAYDASTGAQIWARKYVAGIGFLGLAVSPDGQRVVSVGAANFNDSKGDDFITVAHNASTGQKQWVRRNDSPDPSEDVRDRATGVAFAPDGGAVFVTGVQEGFRAATIAYAAGTGSTKWVVRRTDVNTTRGSFIAMSPDGSRVFVAMSYDTPIILPNSADDFLTIAYDPETGVEQWSALFDDDPGPFEQGVDQVFGMALFDSTKLFVAGVSCVRATSTEDKTCASTDDAVFRTVSYNASTGTQRWTRAFDDGGGSEPHAAAARAGRVFVTGEGSVDILTVAYAA